MLLDEGSTIELLVWVANQKAGPKLSFNGDVLRLWIREV